MTPDPTTTTNTSRPRITPNCQDGNHNGCSGCDCAHHRGSPAAEPEQPQGRWASGPANIRDMVERARQRAAEQRRQAEDGDQP